MNRIPVVLNQELMSELAEEAGKAVSAAMEEWVALKTKTIPASIVCAAAGKGVSMVAHAMMTASLNCEVEASLRHHNEYVAGIPKLPRTT